MQLSATALHIWEPIEAYASAKIATYKATPRTSVCKTRKCLEFKPKLLVRHYVKKRKKKNNIFSLRSKSK